MVCNVNNKTIQHNLQVIEREHRLIGKYEKTKSNLETENIEFNEKFQILTKDPQSGFLLLTPNFMEYILSTDKNANGQIYLCFQGDKVHIAIKNNRNSFEIKPAKLKTQDTEQIRLQDNLKYNI